MASSSSSALVKYDQVPGETFFLCSKCKTHIARTRALVFKDQRDTVGVFRDNDVVNVNVDGEDKKWVADNRSYVHVYCTVCETLLGEQMFAGEREDIVAKKGTTGLSLKRLMVWDGDEMLYAHTLEPVKASKKPVESTAAKKTDSP